MRKTFMKKIVLSICFVMFMFASMLGVAFSNVLPVKTAKAEVTTDGEFEIVDGVSLKLGNVNGLRFIIKMDQTVYDYVTSSDQVELGFVIAPEQLMLDGKGDWLNMAKKIGGPVDKTKIYEQDGYWCANGCISNVKLNNFQYNFVAVGYIAEVTSENDSWPNNYSDIRYTEYNALAKNNLYDTVNMAALNGYETEIFTERAGGYAQVIGKEEGWYGSEDFPIIVETRDEYDALVDMTNEKGIDLNGYCVVVKNSVTPSSGFSDEAKMPIIISDALYEINNLIVALPDSITMPEAIGFVERIHDVEEKYNALSEADKEQVANYEKVESLLAAIEGYDRVYKHDADDGTVIASYVPNATSTIGGSASIGTDEFSGNYLIATPDAGGRVAIQFKNFPSVDKYEKIYFYIRHSSANDYYVYASDDTANDGWGSNWKNNVDAEITPNAGKNLAIHGTWNLIEIDVSSGIIADDWAFGLWLGGGNTETDIILEISDIYGVLKTATEPLFGTYTDSGTTNEYGTVYSLTQSWDSATDLGSIAAGKMKESLVEGYDVLRFWMYNPVASEVSLYGACESHNWVAESLATLAPNAWTEVVLTRELINTHLLKDLCICVKDASGNGVAKTEGWQISKIFLSGTTYRETTLKFDNSVASGEIDDYYGTIYNLTRGSTSTDLRVIDELYAGELAEALPSGYEYFYFYMYNPTDTAYSFHLAGNTDGGWYGNTVVALAANAWTKVVIPATDIEKNKQGGWYVYVLGGDSDGATKEGWKISTIYAGPDMVVDTEIVYLDHADVKEAIALIDAIPEEVTMADKATVETARAAYDALKEDQKTLVSNYEKLTAAEALLISKAEIEEVIAAIDSINAQNIDEALVQTARQKYEALTDDQKTQVTNIATLEGYEAEITFNKQIANVKEMIAALPDSVTMPDHLVFVPRIEAAEAAYKALTEDQKGYITNYTKLSALLDATADYTTLHVQTVDGVSVVPSHVPTYTSTIGGSASIGYDSYYGNYLKVTPDAGGKVAIQFKNFPDVSKYTKLYFNIRVVGASCDIYASDGITNDGWGDNWNNTWSLGGYWADDGNWIQKEFDLTGTYLSSTGATMYIKNIFASNWALGLRTNTTDVSFEITDIIGYVEDLDSMTGLSFGVRTNSGETNEHGAIYDLAQEAWASGSETDFGNFPKASMAQYLNEGHNAFHFWIYNPNTSAVDFRLNGDMNGWNAQGIYLTSLTGQAWTEVVLYEKIVTENDAGVWYISMSAGASTEGWKISNIFSFTEEVLGEVTGLTFGNFAATSITNKYGTVYDFTQGWSHDSDMGAFNVGALSAAITTEGHNAIRFWIYNPQDADVDLKITGDMNSWDPQGEYVTNLPAKTWTQVLLTPEMVELNKKVSEFEGDTSGTWFVNVTTGAGASGWQISALYSFNYEEYLTSNIDKLQERINDLDTTNVVQATVDGIRKDYELLNESQKAFLDITNLTECEKTLYGDVENAPFIVNGETSYKLYVDVTSGMANAAANFANEQLEAATGVSLSVVKARPDTLTQYRYAIVFGYSDLFADLGGSISLDIGDKGYAVKRIGRTVFVVANGTDGYRMGAIAFLREVIGYDMISEDCIVYDESKAATLAQLNIEEIPSFDYRQQQTYMTEAEIYGMGLQSHTDLWIPSSEGWDMHNTLHYLPTATYRSAHPSWYYDYVDSIKIDRTQICPTAGGSSTEFNAMVEAIAANMLVQINAYPEIENISFSIMDTADNDDCTCTRCTLYDTLYGEGGFAAAWIDLMNAINAKIRESLPEDRVLNIAFLAYRGTENAPANIDANGNVTLMKRYQINDDGSYTQTSEDLKCDEGVTVWLAPINALYAENFNHADNATYLATIKKWCALSDSVYLWMYGTNFKYYMYPYNTWQASAENYKILADLGVKAAWSQSNQTEATAFSDLKSYIDSKFMFNVNADYETVLNTYFTNYFGAAATSMRSMFDTIVAKCNTIESENDGLGRGIYDEYEYESSSWFWKTTKTYWSEDELNALVDLCDEAKAAVNADTTLSDEQKTAILSRITKESLFPRYVLCTIYENESDRAAFKADATALGLTLYREADGLLSDLYSDWGV